MNNEPWSSGAMFNIKAHGDYFHLNGSILIPQRFESLFELFLGVI